MATTTYARAIWFAEALTGQYHPIYRQTTRNTFFST